MSDKQLNSNPGGAEWTKKRAIDSKRAANIIFKDRDQQNHRYPFREVTEMCHKCDPSSSVRVDRGLCTKRPASQTIIDTNQIVLHGGGTYDTPLL
jgi:hypothetical protein